MSDEQTRPGGEPGTGGDGQSAVPAPQPAARPDPAADEPDPQGPGTEREAPQVNWWHRDHPTFTAITGFFTGLAYVIIVPGLFAAILYWMFSDHTAEDAYPFVLVSLAVPVGLAIAPRTRRFGLYMLFGVVTTAVVVLGVAAIVLWVLVGRENGHGGSL